MKTSILVVALLLATSSVISKKNLGSPCRKKGPRQIHGHVSAPL
jgi:cathepsin X